MFHRVSLSAQGPVMMNVECQAHGEDMFTRIAARERRTYISNLKALVT